VLMRILGLLFAWTSVGTVVGLTVARAIARANAELAPASAGEERAAGGLSAASRIGAARAVREPVRRG
jgi:hypothetical protein